MHTHMRMRTNTYTASNQVQNITKPISQKATLLPVSVSFGVHGLGKLSGTTAKVMDQRAAAV
jgi:hypothetical protein